MEPGILSEIVFGLVLLVAICTFPIFEALKHKLETAMPERKDWKTILDENRVEIVFWVFLFGTVLAIFG
jgi:hypothetical protein